MRRSLAALAVLTALAPACASTCGRADEEAKKVTTSSSADATKDLVHEHYRFRLAWPGRGWKVLGERDARQLNPDATAGLSNGKITLLVIVEHAPGTDLDAVAELFVDNMAIENKERQPTAETTVGDTPARRFEVTGTVNGMAVRFRGLALAHQDHIYQVLAYKAVGHGDTADLDRALGAFSLVPGKVERPKVSAVVADQLGVGWRIAGGVFESAANRVRIDPPDGWRLMVGDELAHINASAEVGLTSTEVDAYVMILSEPIADANHAAYAAARRTETVGDAEPIGAPQKTQIAGSDIELVRVRIEEGITVELTHGTFFARGRAYQVLAWHAAGLRERAEPLMKRAFAAIELLDDAGVARVDAALAGARDGQNSVGPGHSLRGGVYRDFTHHLRWRRPPGHWRIAVGQEARADDELALLVAEDLGRGVHTQLLVEPAAGWEGAAYHEASVAGFKAQGWTLERSGTSTLAGEPARFSELRIETEDAPVRYLVTTAVIGDLGVQVPVWSVEVAWPGTKAAQAVTAAVERHPGPAIEMEGAAVRDQRLGFEMKLPVSWRRREITPDPLRPIGALHEWKRGRSEILVLAVYTFDKKDEDWMLDLVEQTVRDRGSDFANGSPESSQATVDGRPARQVTWDGWRGRADVFLLQRDATLYGVVAVDPDGDEGVTETARAAFSLLE